MQGSSALFKEYRTPLVLGMAHGLNHAYLLFFSPFLIMIGKDLKVDMVAIGGLVSFAFAAYGVGSLPAGTLSDKLGYRRSVVLATAIPALGCLAGVFARGYAGLALAFALIGLGTSIYHPSGYAFVTQVAKAEIRGTALGVHGVGGNVGMVVAPALTALVAGAAGWRRGFLLWGLIGLAAALAFRALLPEASARDLGSNRTLDETDPIGQEATGEVGPGENKVAKPDDAPTNGNALFSMTAVLVLAVLAIQGFFTDGIFAFLPTFLQVDKAMGVVASGLVSAVTYGGGVFGQLLGGVAADRWGRKSSLWAGSSGCLAAFALLPSLSHAFLLGGAVLVLGFCAFMLQPAINAMVADVTPTSLRGAAYGVVFLSKYGVGALAPFVGGIIAASYGLSAFLYLLAGVTLCSMLLLSMVKETRSPRLKK